MRIVVVNHVTLDGVMQGPGRPDEDTRDGFTRGGWAEPRGDEIQDRAWAARLGNSGGLLLGRRTYEDVLGYWNTQDSPFRAALNNTPKYVVSRTLTPPLPWPNSTLLDGDLKTAVSELKRAEGKDLHIMGSGELIRSLGALGLIDEYMLSIHPIVLGTGHRLFSDGFDLGEFELVEATPTTTGVLIATYRPAA
ncbi:dihydrofolate reductase [Amycolatopsis bartoniae]|uniref:Deaminase reductase n=1 Tax=Amycolatopsis bartoniae TaxID=941986 RepID=A0A8H9J0D0_9PSEU|nr:dihydrofolate reductase family protein [Amycolatopsis bartoniae]MBB2937438.1 dihydrofolate reductase [Amycolatopsis bartoniae]TVT00076.1 dihydrofolate reductase [Amycolatopsis bartoniae]GHF86771.1 deaminase reductase [Amycolatopsis bartoniae]